MTCGLYDGIEIHFLESGLHVTPYEVSTRSNSKEFSYTKCKVSRDDGELIATRAEENEPVTLTFDGAMQDRYMFHPEAVSLHNEDATLTLYDGLKVLDKGTINKNFQDSELHEVIDFIVEKAQDPNGVITGVKHPTEGLQNLEVRDGQTGGQDGWFGAGIGLFGRGFEIIKQFEFEDTSLKFKEMTPYGALSKTASAFALETWVDNDGKLTYGMKGADADTFNLTADSTGARLKEYNVSVGSGKLSQLILRGPYRYLKKSVIGPQGTTSGSTYAYGKAWLSDDGERVPGQTKEPEEMVGPTNPKAVEDLARLHLVQHYRNRKNGNLVLNAGASSEKRRLTQMDVGDFISAEAEIEEHCQRRVDTGIFVVNSVKHNLDKRRGWLIDVGVSALPTDEIASESWLENPARDERWDSVDDYDKSIQGT